MSVTAYFVLHLQPGKVLPRSGRHHHNCQNAEAALQHGADIKEMVQEPLKVVGAGNVKINVVGPAAELEKLKPKLAPRGAVFWELDSEAFWM